MKAAFYVLCLVLSLPNLALGFALTVLDRTFRSRDVFQIIVDFLQSVVWGVPVVATILLTLFLLGFFPRTRPYAAICTLVLNIAALSLVISRMGMPADGNERIVFNPVVIALVGCAFIGYHDLKRRLRPTSSPISATATPRS